MAEKIYDTIVIGAGAAGLFYGASDDRCYLDEGEHSAKPPGGRLILEATSHPGQKLLISGSGACNITHGGSIKDFIGKYNEGKAIRTALYRHNNLELMSFMEGLGVPLGEREDGKVFPRSMKARDVRDALIAAASGNGYDISCGCRVTGFAEREGCTELTLEDGRRVWGRTVVIASGGASYPGTGSDGRLAEVLKRDLKIEIKELQAALVPIFVQGYCYTDIAGVSIGDAEIRIFPHKARAGGNGKKGAKDGMQPRRGRGCLLFTHRGFSGPVILGISAGVRAGDEMTVNYLPAMTGESILARLRKDQPGNRKGIANYLAEIFELPKAFTRTLHQDPARPLSSFSGRELENVVRQLTAASYSISGTGSFDVAMVTSGGVALSEINMKTMELTNHPGIYVIGEAVDIDGDTGGYNLQWAYSSACTAIEGKKAK